MQLRFFDLIKNELEQVDQLINKELKLKTGHASKFAHLDLSPLEKHLRPALVILTARLFNRTACEKVISLAGIVQFIYTASQIHLRISDIDPEAEEREFLDPRDGSQLPVLVGDYLYGKFFTTLCEAQMLPFLKPLAEIICLMNEGNVLKKKTEHSELQAKEELLDVLEMETAELMAGSCRLGAELADAHPNDVDKTDYFGRYLGMAFGLIESGVSFDKASEYLKKALNVLLTFKETPARIALENLVHMLMAKELIIEKQMVV